MERASKLMWRLPLPGEAADQERMVCAAWPQCVGKKIAAHTRAVRLVRARLVVEVEDELWRRQLFGLSGQVLRVLERDLGRGVVEDIEFRRVPRRREPQRAATATPAHERDEAAGIADPVLRSLYRASRRKALA
jgi:predicted nucleic acid-binding Zn ribbon protein